MATQHHLFAAGVLVVLLVAASTATATIHSADLPMGNGKNSTPWEPYLIEQTVFRNTTRFKYVHMTMIEQVDERRFLFAFQASKIGEGHKDQRIVLSRSTDKGKTWSDPVDIIWSSIPDTPVWGPCLFHHPHTNVTYLYYAQGVPMNVRAGGRHYPGGDIYVVNSTDFGTTWSTPVLLLRYDSRTRGNVSKMTANKPIFLNRDKTEWALPFWQEVHKTNKNDTGPLCAGVLVTTDNGASYAPFGFIQNNQTWLIENTLVPVTQLPQSHGFGGNLTLVQYFRVKAPVVQLFISTSHDGGRTWSTAEPIKTIENPDSKISAAARMRDDGTPEKVMLSLNPNLQLNRRLLVAMQSTEKTTPLPTTIHYGDVVVLGNTTHYKENHDTWSYPTVLAVKGAKSPMARLWAVSFTAWGTKGAKLAWISDEHHHDH